MTLAHQIPLSMGFPQQEYWSGLLCPSPGDLPDQGIETAFLMSPCIGRWVLTTEPPGKPHGSTDLTTNPTLDVYILDAWDWSLNTA